MTNGDPFRFPFPPRRLRHTMARTLSAPRNHERDMTANGPPAPSTPSSDGITVVPPAPGAGALLPDPHIPPEPGDQASPLPGARTALLVLLAINLFNYIDRQVLGANLPHIEEQFLPQGGPYNKTYLGYLATAFVLSYTLLSLPFTWLTHYISRWKLVGAAVILWSLASGGSGLAGSFLILLLTRALVGVGEAAYGPVAPDMISDLYPVKTRGNVLAWFYVAMPVGSALGYALAALGLFIFGVWRWSFYLVVLPGLVLGIWCFFLPEPPLGHADLGPNGRVRPPRWRDYLRLFRNPSYVLATLGMTALTFAAGAVAHWMPDYVAKYRHGASLETTNLIFGILVVVGGLSGTLLGGWAGDALRPRFSGSYFLVSGMAMLLAFPCFLGVLFLPFAPFPWAWIFVFLTCFFIFFSTGPSNAILANVTHPALRARAFAINILIIHILGDAISPPVVGAIADAWAETRQIEVMVGYSMVPMTARVPAMNLGLLAVSVVVLLGGVIWLMGVPFLARDTANAPKQLDQTLSPGVDRAIKERV
jgi:MFS family permease